MGWTAEGAAGAQGAQGETGPAGAQSTAWAELSRRSGSAAAITLTTAGTYYPWADALLAEQSDVADIEARLATDDILVTLAGKYRVQLSNSFSGSANADITAAICVDGTPVISLERMLGSGGDIGAAACGGFISLTGGQVVSVKYSADSNSKTVTPKYLSITLLRVGAIPA